jgi:hypothetical protein
MLIEWEPGFKSVEVGDFTDPSGGSDLMIVGGVAKSLKKNGIKGFSAGRVEFSNNLSRGRGRRPFEPRDLPKFYELLVKFVAEIDLEKTTFRIKRHPTIEEEREYYENIREGYGAILDKYPKLSENCGKEYREYYGYEQDVCEDYNPKKGDLVYKHIPRVKGCGYFVRRSALMGCDIFRLEDLNWVFCTDRVKLLIESGGFTNIRFLEMGDVIED